MMWPSEPIYTSRAARPCCPVVPHTLPKHRPILLHTSLLPASHGRSQHAEPAEIGPHVYEEGLTARRAVTLALEDLVEDLSMYAIKADQELEKEKNYSYNIIIRHAALGLHIFVMPI